jgi:TrmH family RNA methyltransferase
MLIESKHNPRFKAWKKLLTKKGRKEQGQFLIEGEHLVNDALHSGWPIVEVITSEDFECPKEWREHFPVLITERKVVPDTLFVELSETMSPQGVALVVKKTTPRSLEEVVEQSQCLILVDQVQDPGNLGTIIRTADAAGVGGVLLGKGTVDPFSGKVLRSTQGSIFHLPVYEQELDHIIPALQEKGWVVYGTSLQGAIDYRETQIQGKQKVALLVGNEGEGVAEDILNLVDQKIKIPIWGNAESLNVAIATGILVYHIQSQLKKNHFEH